MTERERRLGCIVQRRTALLLHSDVKLNYTSVEVFHSLETREV